MASTLRATLLVCGSVLVFTALLVFATPAAAQNKAVYTGYKGIMIGTSTADVRQKLGKAREQTDSEDYWEFSDDESARILYDDKKKVRAISVNYSAGDAAAPKPEAILGQSVEAKADGSIFKMVEYRKDGFWISYVKTSGSNALVIVTVQKLDKS